jgi:pentatricopeptide repeat protein
LEQVVAPHLVEQTKQLLSAETADMAMKAALKGKMHTTELSKRVRRLERLIGSLGKTPLTDKLSLRLVEANGKAGNIGRVLSLLNLRSSRGYQPLDREFRYAVQAIDSAGLFLREGRNILLGDTLQPDIDNPTRWLDAILTNMHTRNHPLSIRMANRMLNTYASTGKTSKALHFFYYISRQPMVDPETLDPISLASPSHKEMPKFKQRRVRVKMKFRPPPRYYKVPSESRDKLVALPGEMQRRLKLDLESDPNWSVPLTAAFSFADSLTHGACGHPPMELDVVSWNTLMKACCYRGSLWRAMQLLKDTMPQQGIEPDTISYNTILAGLARVVRDTVVLVLAI